MTQSLLSFSSQDLDPAHACTQHDFEAEARTRTVVSCVQVQQHNCHASSWPYPLFFGTSPFLPFRGSPSPSCSRMSLFLRLPATRLRLYLSRLFPSFTPGAPAGQVPFLCCSCCPSTPPCAWRTEGTFSVRMEWLDG